VGGGLDLVERITEELLPLAQPPLVRLLETKWDRA